MSKFRTSVSEDPIPESIVLMFRDLNRDPSVKYLWQHQGKILEDYHQNHIHSKDLAIELPTGTGKTLVGLLIAEYRRRAFKERIVFLCPTKQLCSQINQKAQLYGIKTSLLVGPQKKYDRGMFYEYRQSKAIAITTYSGLFNINPRINDPEVIICDDAHSADNYITDLWTLSISKEKHISLYRSIYSILEPAIPDSMKHRIKTGGNNHSDEYYVDMISTIASFDYYTYLSQRIGEIVAKDDDLEYSWSILSSHFEACSIYISPKTIEIRPLIPPTKTHKPFSNAKQRVYMSATLGEDGDIERVFGIKKIARLPIPEEWHKRSTGRRLILFPGLSTNENPEEVAVQMLKKVDRALILVPNDPTLQEWEDKISQSHTVVKSGDIEQNLDSFTKCPHSSALLLANRYDGIDLPGDDCRLMILNSEPSASGLQELYLRTGLGASSQLNNRIRTRITQAMGRCTRDESDYSVVVVLGEKLTDRCCTSKVTKGMHPELQAEISFGLDNSTDRNAEDFVELAEEFLTQTPGWQDAEQEIRKRRDSCSKNSDSTAKALAKAMPYEIDYMYASWKGEYEKALDFATKILEALEGGEDLRPYRAFWHHQTATTAFLHWKHSKNDIFKSTAISYLEKASLTSSNITWLGKLRSQLSGVDESSIPENLPTQDWFLVIHKLLQEWGIRGGNYAKKICEVQIKIESQKAKPFENGLDLLGKMLGATTHKWPDDGAPDGLWIFGSWYAFVFEAKTDENAEDSISLKTVRQALTHEERVRSDKLIPDFMPCSTVIISPRTNVHNLAVHHVKDLAYISHNDIISLFNDAAIALERIRMSASGSSEEALQLEALKVYTEKSIFMKNIKELLLNKKLKDMPSSR